MTFVSNGAEGRGRVVTAGTLDAEVISDTMDIRKLKQMSLFVSLVRGGGLTALVMSMDCSFDGAVWLPIQNQDQTPPDKALVDATWTKTISITGSWMFDVSEGGLLGAPFLRLRFTGTASTVADVIDVDAYGEA